MKYKEVNQRTSVHRYEPYAKDSTRVTSLTGLSLLRQPPEDGGRRREETGRGEREVVLGVSVVFVIILYQKHGGASVKGRGQWCRAQLPKSEAAQFAAALYLMDGICLNTAEQTSPKRAPRQLDARRQTRKEPSSSGTVAPRSCFRR